MKTQTLSIIVAVLLVGAGAFSLLFFEFVGFGEPDPTTLPTAVPYGQSATAPTPSAVAEAEVSSVVSSESLPMAVNLDIPFTPQAPLGAWELPYKEFCEEASVLMAASFIGVDSFSTPEQAAARMNAIFDWAKQNIGPQVDTNAAETARMLREFYGISEVEVVEDPSAQQLKEALADRRVVIVPAAGQQLNNPYFTPPGPPYHMLVLKGYTADGKFIANDPGTRRGGDYLYDVSTIMRAMHDWHDEDVESGRKVVIFVG